MNSEAAAAADGMQPIPGPRAFGSSLRRFWTLVWLSSVAEFKLMYSGSIFGAILGYLWALARPLLIFVIIYIVFSKVLRVGDAVPFYASMLLLNLTLFFLLADASNRAIQAFVSREGVLRKVQFPRAVVPFSIVLTGVFTFAMDLVAVFAVVLAVGTPPRWTWLLLPLLWITMLIFALAAAVTLSTLYVRYRDVVQIWAVVVAMLFYASPIMYPTEQIPDDFRWMLIINPIAPIFEQMRVWAVDPSGPTALEAAGNVWGLIGPLLVFSAVLVYAAFLVTRMSRSLAEDL